MSNLFNEIWSPRSNELICSNSNREAAFTAAATVVVAGLVTSAAGTAAAGTPPKETGCPASFQQQSLSDLLSRGHYGIEFVDANADGLICTKPLNPQVQEMFCFDLYGPAGCSVPVIYYLRENDTTTGAVPHA